MRGNKRLPLIFFVIFGSKGKVLAVKTLPFSDRNLML